MSLSDRDYARRPSPSGPGSPFGRGGRFGGPGGPGGRRLAFGTPGGMTFMVKVLLILNIAVFLLDWLLGEMLKAPMSPIFRYGAFNVTEGLYGVQLWRWITGDFLHAGFFHLFANMIGLFYFGPDIERYFGSARFLAFYLLCGLVSTGAYVAMYRFLPGLSEHSFLVGASGSIFGILVAAALRAPDRRIMLLIPPIPMKLRTMTWLFLGLAALNVIRMSLASDTQPVASGNVGGDVAHLGGALAGFLLVRFPGVLNFAAALDGKLTGKRDGKGGAKGRGPNLSGPQSKSTNPNGEARTRRQRKTEQEVDRILIKVKEQGLQSLTDKEKRTLQEATDH